MSPMQVKDKTIQRILVGTDFSRSATNALHRAILLAKEHSARLEIVHVAPRIDRAMLRSLGLHPPDEAASDAERRERLQVARAAARKQGVVASVRLLKGGAATELALEAARLCADVVVLGCLGARSLKHALIGTTAERVIERWSGDTLIVRRAPAATYRVILASVALAPVSRSVVMSALSLSHDARILVLHTYQPPYELTLLSHHADSQSHAKHRAATRRAAVRGLDTLLAQCPVPEDRRLDRHVLYGEPSSTIPGVAVHHNADVIVVGKNMSLVEQLLLGSVTKKIVRAAASDVLVSDPRGRPADAPRRVRRGTRAE